MPHQHDFTVLLVKIFNRRSEFARQFLHRGCRGGRQFAIAKLGHQFDGRVIRSRGGEGPFTVFAPTDAAFAKLPDGTVSTLLKPENAEMLRSVLTYHVVPGNVSATQLIGMIESNGGTAELTTVQGGTLTASMSDGNVILTDAKGGTATVVQADVKASNGVIHATDAVSLPA